MTPGCGARPAFPAVRVLSSTLCPEYLGMRTPSDLNLLSVILFYTELSSNMSRPGSTGTSADSLLRPTRVVLRFATASAPENDEDVYRPFLAQENVDHQDYYVHIQPRDYDRTHIVIDFCESSSVSINYIPHRLYRVTWKDSIPCVFISKNVRRPVRLTKNSNYEEMNEQWTKKAKDLTSAFRWFK